MTPPDLEVERRRDGEIEHIVPYTQTLIHIYNLLDQTELRHDSWINHKKNISANTSTVCRFACCSEQQSTM